MVSALRGAPVGVGPTRQGGRRPGGNIAVVWQRHDSLLQGKIRSRWHSIGKQFVYTPPAVPPLRRGRVVCKWVMAGTAETSIRT